jgi:hypothetical protein
VAARTGNHRGASGGHTVLFYRDPAELSGQVSTYLLEAVAAGGVAVVIATREHRDAIAAAMARAGTDVAAAQADGRYIALDASETMDQFMVADWPSAASFWQAISPVIRKVAQHGGPVHLFGEMVALLWDFGQVNAAIEVEAMWNELAAQYPLSLFCAYPADSVGGEAHQDALAELCRLHSSVAGDPAGGARGA